MSAQLVELGRDDQCAAACRGARPSLSRGRLCDGQQASQLFDVPIQLWVVERGALELGASVGVVNPGSDRAHGVRVIALRKVSRDFVVDVVDQQFTLRGAAPQRGCRRGSVQAL